MIGNNLYKIKVQINSKHLYTLSLVIVILFINFLTYGATSEKITGTEDKPFLTQNTNQSYLSTLSLVVAILTVLVTLAVFIPTIIAFVQLSRIYKELDRCTQLADEAEKQISSINESVKDFRHPDLIIAEAKEKAEKICDLLGEGLRNHINAIEEDIKEGLNKIQVNNEKVESSYYDIRERINSIQSEVKSKASISEIIVEVDKKYKIPEDLSKILLGRVESAFGCLNNLSKEERKDIRNTLNLNLIPPEQQQ